jgi:hypothetical protein
MPKETDEGTNSWWYLTYGLVLLFAICVILALALFTRYFSM